MRILLINPPLSDPTLPSLSIPVLSAFTKSQGYNVEIYDLSIEAYDYFTSREKIEENIRIIESRLNTSIYQHDKEFLGIARRAQAIAPIIIEKIEWAKNGLRSGECFYNYQLYKSALSIFANALDLLQWAYYPTSIMIADYYLKESHTLKTVKEHLGNIELNPFLTYFQNIAIPKISKLNCDLIGISLTYRGQFLPALTLLQELHKALPSVAVILGGAFLTALGDRLSAMGEILRGAKGVVLFEGETALVEIAECVEIGSDVENAVNTYTIEDVCQGNIPKQPLHIENIEELPTPDFDGIPLEYYLTPEPILPIQSCRGCYWGKCTFCAVSKATSSKFRKRSHSKILADLDTLYEKYSCRHFMLCDDATHPSTLEAIANHVIQNNLPYSWSTEARFGPWLTKSNCRKLSKGGCVHLAFGFESASERILSLMQKGPIHLWRMKNLQACRNTNICVNLQVFFGFPGETKSEAELTEDFFYQHQNLYTSIGLGSFNAALGCKVSTNPSSFGVRLVEEMEPLLEPWYCFEVKSGMSARESAEFADQVRSKLVIYDNVGPGFLFCSGGAHGHLYSSQFGRQFIDGLSTDSYRWKGDIATSRYIASESSNLVFLVDDNYLVFDRMTGHSLIVQETTKKAFNLLKESPQTIPDTVAACSSQSKEGFDSDELPSLTKTISALIRLVRMGILVPFKGKEIE